MKMSKEKMIDMMEEAKAMVSEVWGESNVDRVGDVLCDIDEAMGAIEEEVKE